MGYILLIGTTEDVVLQYFVRFLIKQNASIVFVNQAQLGHSIWVDERAWHWQHKGQIVLSVRHQDISGILNRALDPKPFTHATQWAQQQMLYHLLDEFAENVVNRPKNTLSNSSKLYQHSLIQAQSWSLPSSWVIANAHWQHLGQRPQKHLIFKSISAIRSKVKRLPQEGVKPIHEPVLFQTCHRGINVRVHVLDQQCFALAIVSDRIDYRYPEKNNRFVPIELPDHIKKDVRNIARRCSLRFAGIDLIYQKGQYYVLEANPSPGWRYFEEHMQSPIISHALMHALQNNAPKKQEQITCG